MTNGQVNRCTPAWLAEGQRATPLLMRVLASLGEQMGEASAPSHS